MAVNESGSLSGTRDLGVLLHNLRSKDKGVKYNNLLGYAFIAPAMILYLVFNIWPIVRGLLMAFTDYRFVYPDTRWDFNGVNNFTKMAGDKNVHEALGVALKYTALVLPVTIILALLVAVLISRVRHGASFYRWVVYLPSILPVAVSFLMFREMYGLKFGLISNTLRGLGMANPPNWLGDATYALPSIALAHLWIIFGFPTLLFLIGIYNIGSEVYEAAGLDGANGWQQLRWITIPLLKPTFALILVLLIGIIGVTDPMLILTAGGPEDSTRTIGLHIYQLAFVKGDLRLGYAAAISLVIGLFSALVSALVFRWSRE
jgi:multiple sugar transport system permease protein